MFAKIKKAISNLFAPKEKSKELTSSPKLIYSKEELSFRAKKKREFYKESICDFDHFRSQVLEAILEMKRPGGPLSKV